MTHKISCEENMFVNRVSRMAQKIRAKNLKPFYNHPGFKAFPFRSKMYDGGENRDKDNYIRYNFSKKFCV